MAKGSLFVGSGSGKVGNLVLANTKQGQVTRAYQPRVTNPKSAAQMRQRAKFANAVKFFKMSVQAYFKYAYEDKAQNESDYNAFMRHNIRISAPMSREEYLEPTIFPVGKNWLMSQGRLTNSCTYKADKSLVVTIPGLGAVTTVGGLSTALIAAGLEAGDIVTLLNITNDVSSDKLEDAISDGSNFIGTGWTIAQFIVDETSEVALTAVPATGELASGGVVTLTVDADAHTVKLPDSEDAVILGALIVTRKVDGGLHATTSELVGNAAYDALADAVLTDAAVANSLVSWGSKGTAILKGSIAQG